MMSSMLQSTRPRVSVEETVTLVEDPAPAQPGPRIFSPFVEDPVRPMGPRISVEETTVLVEDPIPAMLQSTCPRGADLPLTASVVPERLVHPAPRISFEDVRLTMDDPTPAHRRVTEAFGTSWSPHYHYTTKTSTSKWLCYAAIIVAVIIFGAAIFVWFRSSKPTKNRSPAVVHGDYGPVYDTPVVPHVRVTRPIHGLNHQIRVAAQPGKTTVIKKHSVTPVPVAVGNDGRILRPGDTETTTTTGKPELFYDPVTGKSGWKYTKREVRKHGRR